MKNSIAKLLILSLLSWQCGNKNTTPEPKKPIITAFTPQSGGVGTEVTITGSNFTEDTRVTTVSFNGIKANIISITANTIVVNVPKNATTGKITIAAIGQNGISATDFQVIQASITGFEPQNAPVGSQINIKGNGFSLNPSENLVSFGEVKAEVITATANNLTVKVPQGAITNKVSVVIGDRTTTSSMNFIVNDSWKNVADLAGTSRLSAIAFSIGNKGYVGLGYGINVYYKDFWEYDPTTNTWTQKADFAGTGRAGAVSFSIGEVGFVGLGSTGLYPNQTSLNDFWAYDPATNTWISRTSFPGGIRYGASSFVVNGKAYAGLGYHSSNSVPTYYKDWYEYNPITNTWLQKADFIGNSKNSAFSFAIGNKGYVGGGQENISGTSTATKDLYEYDPLTNSWTRKADLPSNASLRYASASFSIGNKGYVGGGRDNDYKILKDFWAYDPATNTWLQKADASYSVPTGGGYITGKASVVSFVVNGKAYVGTGEDSYSSLRKDFWEYTP
ncbi:MAG: IPT/TIG domain-containing protein [Raineya sp.]|jgi:N-acetylneuraminic acid mutarotase|nr:IPT/TIG domain-containing protein [Raineya sp.]